MNDEIDGLKARVTELERRIEILFSNTGAIDFEEAGRGASPVSAEVEELLRRDKLTKAVKLYQQETGADMAQAMAALKSAKDSLG